MVVPLPFPFFSFFFVKSGIVRDLVPSEIPPPLNLPLFHISSFFSLLVFLSSCGVYFQPRGFSPPPPQFPPLSPFLSKSPLLITPLSYKALRISLRTPSIWPLPGAFFNSFPLSPPTFFSQFSSFFSVQQLLKAKGFFPHKARYLSPCFLCQTVPILFSYLLLCFLLQFSPSGPFSC